MIVPVLLGHVWRSQRTKVVTVALALGAWAALLPLIYASFGQDMRRILESGIVPQSFLDMASSFGGGDIFSLPGSVALGFVHPIAVALECVFAVGFASAAVAGERQRGTLEVLLSRPISRPALVVTLFVALAGFVALTVGAHVVATVASAIATGVSGELDLATFPLLWLNGVLLFLAVGAIGLAASVSTDRLTPALGVTLAIVLGGYVLQILGSLWPDAAGLQPYSLFHYLRPQEVLAGDADPASFVVLAAVTVAALACALVVFPRRDLAAPT